MYSFIVNPETNKKISVTSFVGKNILRNYLKILKGGSRRAVLDEFEVVEKDSVLSDVTFGELEVFSPYYEMVDSGLQKHHVLIKMRDDGWTEDVIKEFVSGDRIIKNRDDKISFMALDRVNVRMLEGFTFVDSPEETSSKNGSEAIKETDRDDEYTDEGVLVSLDRDVEYLREDIDCVNNINRRDRRPQGSGTFKIAHKPRCKKGRFERSKAPFQHIPECEQSSLMLYKSRGYEGDERLKKEIQLQVEHNGPEIYKYGMCVGLKDTSDYRAYKLEEKYDKSLLDLRAQIHFPEATTNIKNSLKSMLIDFAINFHGKHLAHYDIKLGNVLVKFVSPDNTHIIKMKVIDYGLADSVISRWSLEGGTGSLPGTIGWKDPSATETGILNYKTDIWAFGKLILLVYFGSYFNGPFDIQRGFTLEENLNNIYNNSSGKTNSEGEEETVDEWCGRVFRMRVYSKIHKPEWVNLRTLLFYMLHRNQLQRYNIIQVIESDFFRGILPNESAFLGYVEAKRVISGLDSYVQSEMRAVYSSGGGGGGASK